MEALRGQATWPRVTRLVNAGMVIEHGVSDLDPPHPPAVSHSLWASVRLPLCNMENNDDCFANA